MAQTIPMLSFGADIDSRYIQISRYGESAVDKIENSPRAIRAWLQSINTLARKFTGQRKLTKKGDGECRRLIYNAAMTAGRFVFKPHMEQFKVRGMKAA